MWENDVHIVCTSFRIAQTMCAHRFRRCAKIITHRSVTMSDKTHIDVLTSFVDKKPSFGRTSFQNAHIVLDEITSFQKNHVV